MTLPTCTVIVVIRPGRRLRQALGEHQRRAAFGRSGACPSFGSLKTEEDERQCGQRVVGFAFDDAVCRFRGRFPPVTTRTSPVRRRSSARPGQSPGRQEHGTHYERCCSGARHHHLIVSAGSARTRPVLDGEFDPGSGRTLAACLTHTVERGPSSRKTGEDQVANGCVTREEPVPVSGMARVETFANTGCRRITAW